VYLEIVGDTDETWQSQQKKETYIISRNNSRAMGEDIQHRIPQHGKKIAQILHKEQKDAIHKTRAVHD
jgi:predicted secreted Zn-dependent protease